MSQENLLLDFKIFTIVMHFIVTLNVRGMIMIYTGTFRLLPSNSFFPGSVLLLFVRKFVLTSSII
jgi:hypothetical protein